MQLTSEQKEIALVCVHYVQWIHNRKFSQAELVAMRIVLQLASQFGILSTLEQTLSENHNV